MSAKRCSIVDGKQRISSSMPLRLTKGEGSETARLKAGHLTGLAWSKTGFSSQKFGRLMPSLFMRSTRRLFGDALLLNSGPSELC
jgi:hypothetical protein